MPEPKPVDNTRKSKRIASNTLVLFVRMFLIMIINLYAVRIVLHGLGEIDYGTYNAVAGVVFTGSFLITTLAIAIQRFYSYALGEKAEERLSQIFTASLNIILLLVFVLLIIFETVGVWFVNTQLNIPPESISTAQWLFQLAIFSLAFSFIQIPFTAAIFAHEDMGIFALISLLECLGRFTVAVLIGKWLTSNGLLFYGAGLFAVAILVFFAYVFIARHRYPECRYKRHVNGKLYKELLSFSGWTTYSALSGMSIIHGNTILLNIFFGPIATASYAIANQIHNAIAAVGNSIVIAFRPAMVKTYAEKDYQYLNTLFYASNKAIFYLMLCVSIPLIIEMPVILGWWLDSASNQLVLFSRLFVVFMMMLMMQYPITTIIQSTGKVKYYSLFVDSITLLCLPVSWLLYRLDAPDYSCFLSMIGIYLIAHIVRIICLRHYYPQFSYSEYAKSLMLPGTIISAIILFVAYAFHQHITSVPLEFLSVSFAASLLTLLLAYIIGLSKQEKRLLYSFANKLIKHKKG